jgi:hypothetical protein
LVIPNLYKTSTLLEYFLDLILECNLFNLVLLKI